MRTCVLRALTVFAFLWLLQANAAAQESALTLGRGIDQLTRESTLIVRASVHSAVVEPHPQFKNLMTLLVTLDVKETLKGKAAKTVTYRQFIWDPRARLNKMKYGKGEEVLLLLGPESQYGLRSPAGLEQGRFRVMRDAKGNVTVINGRGNAGLFNSAVQKRAAARSIKLSSRTAALVAKPRAGALPLADVEEAIRTFAGAGTKGGAK